MLRSRAVRLSSVLAPPDREFFDLFEEAGGNILRAARLLEEMLRDYPDRSELARDILICERRGDRVRDRRAQRVADSASRSTSSSLFQAPTEART
jgi:uncharacterized protein Yka (UPF0111/DUF47 family)